MLKKLIEISTKEYKELKFTIYRVADSDNDSYTYKANIFDESGLLIKDIYLKDYSKLVYAARDWINTQIEFLKDDSLDSLHNWLNGYETTELQKIPKE